MTFRTSLAAVALVVFAPVLRAAGPVRDTTNFDAGWSFLKGDAPGAQAPDFSTADWRTVSLPHDWAIEGPFTANAPTRGAGAYAPSGVSWYRKSFTLAPADAGKHIFIDFDGIMANSDVWINGFHLGQRPYGYVGLHYELTGHLTAGPNVIAVRTDTTQQPASRYYEGAGIYRHVRLVATDAVHIDNWGTFVTTPKVSEKEATVHVRSTVLNQADVARDVALQITLLDPDGKQVASGQAAAKSVAANGSADIDAEMTLAAPQLWSLDKPALYTAVATVLAGGKPVDDESVPVGIRHFEFKPDTGFWLNDKNFKLKGVCLHADAEGFGLAVPEDEWIFRLQTLKQFGATAVRTAHNPPSPEFLSACDKVGIVVMDEMFDCWNVGKNAYDYHLFFRDWDLADTRDTVRRDRNHPSIVLYSAGNEIHDTPNAANALAILRPLVQTFHANDPTRPVTQALFRPNSDGGGGAYANGLSDLLDVVGTNYRDAELLAAWRAKPTRMIVGTENGKTPAVWAFVRDNPQYSGDFIWTGVDYLGETMAFPSVAAGAGILDMSDHPKTEAYQRGSWWSDKPVVYIARGAGGGGGRGGGGGPAMDWTPANLNPHTEAVSVYSNCDEVELFLNDTSLGSRPRGQVDSVRTWQVDFAAGTLKAVGKNKTVAVATAELVTAGRATKIALQPSTDKLFADADSVAHVIARVTDDKGVLVPNAAAMITFKVSGPGAISLLENGSRQVQDYHANPHATLDGQCVAFIRATGAGGKITLTASAPNLEEATLTFDTAAARAAR